MTSWNALHLLDLPPELILTCLAHLPYADLKTCFRIQNRLLRYILTSSMLVRYRFEEHSACVEENPAQTAYSATADLLDALRTREGNWHNFTPRTRQTLAVDFVTSGVYDLASDIYLVGDKPDPNTGLSTAVKYFYTSAEVPRWRSIPVGKPIIDFGNALHEHDLLALITYTRHDKNPGLFSVEVLLLEFPTGHPHPLAARPTLHIHDVVEPFGRPGVSMAIVGENLAISLVYWGAPQRGKDSLHIYNWTTGVAKIAPSPVNNTGLIFLSPEILIVPNIEELWLEVYHIPSDQGEFAYVTDYFYLPELIPRHGIMSLNCRGDPNPSTSCARPSRSTFLPRPDTALLLFTFRVGNLDGHLTRHVFVVDRAHFLAALARDRDAEPILHDWAEWGPQCTRWLDVAGLAAGVITTICGTRLVAIAPDAGLRPAPIRVLDFNQAHVRAQRAAGPTERVRVVEADEDPDEDAGVGTAVSAVAPFIEPIVSLLPYVETTSEELFTYTAVLLNDENVIGAKYGHGALESLEVLHFG